MITPLLRRPPGDGPLSTQRPTWDARLDLRVERRGGRSVLASNRHEGPLRVQKALYPEGPARADLLLVHPPAGIAGGDRLFVDLELAAGAQARVTTPGATKWYRSGGAPASQSVTLRIGDGAVLEWLPQESIAFDGAHVRTATDIGCTTLARACGWELWMLGRQASGERYTRGSLDLRTVLRRDGRLLWHESVRLAADDPLRDSPCGWNGRGATGTLWAIGLPADDSLLEAARAVAEPGVALGVTRFEHGLLLARALAGSAERLRAVLTAVWNVLRPALCGSPATAPRIWST